MTVDIEFLGASPIQRLKKLMQILRDPHTGCPWDREQRYGTISPYTIEEAYEVADAVERGDMADLKEELGDLLFQVIFFTQMSAEDKLFGFDDVCDDLTRKMVRRHPHIFGNEAQRKDAAHQTHAWEAMKAQEREAKGQTQDNTSLLDNVPLGLPALTRAEKLQKRAARVGFDWPSLDGVMDKITEEAQELVDAHKDGYQDNIEDEIGDLLFSVANLARKMGVAPETALRRTNHKFTSRFQYIEAQAAHNNTAIEELSLDQMEAYWQEAKDKLS